MADTDDADLRLRFRVKPGMRGLVLEQLHHSLSLCLNGASRSFLNEDIAIFTVFKSEEHQVDSLFKTHDETGHLRLGKCDRVAFANLVDPERDDGAA